MNIVFAGTPEFSATALQALLDSGHTVPLVLTQPDRPAGRGMLLKASAVKQCAMAAGIPVFQPERLRDAQAFSYLKEQVDWSSVEVMVVAAYGLILPQNVLDLPRRGCLNIHASLLPRWRGAAPIHRAILAGDHETGIAIMQMEAGLDTGPVLYERNLSIKPEETTGQLHNRLACLGGEAITYALTQLDNLEPRTQATEGVTYAAKIEKAEARINWTDSATLIDRKIRAFNPFPGAYTEWREGVFKLWRARPEPTDHGAVAGTLLSADSNGIVIACGEGALRVLELQKAGGKRQSAAAMLSGLSLAAGDHFS